MLKVGTTVRVCGSPDPILNETLVTIGAVGFINELAPRMIADKQLYYVNILDEASFPRGSLLYNCTLPEECLAIDKSISLQAAKCNYQAELDAIAQECEDRNKCYQEVLSYLAKTYKISKDEVYAIYKAMLDYESFYKQTLS